VWNLYSGNLLLTLPDPEASIWSVAYSPDGKFIATAGSGKYVYLWDAQTGKPVYELEAGQEFLKCLSFSPDGSTLVAAGNVIRLWDMVGLGLNP
jgi:WD40 repeat protein